MGILDNFEKGLERAVNSAFAKTFRSGLQPVEIGSALKRELDTKAAIVSRDRILVPNSFEVKLAPSDFQRMTGLGVTLIDDLTGIVQKHAADQSFQFAGGLSVGLVEDPRLSTGVLEIASSTIQRDVTWVPVLDVGGKRYPLSGGRTIIGRGREADITVDDTGISRKHLEILWDGKHAQAHDLDSTNGSQLNGQPLTRAIVEPDSVIQLGRTRVVFRVLAESASAAAASARPAASPVVPASAPDAPPAAPSSRRAAAAAPAAYTAPPIAPPAPAQAAASAAAPESAAPAPAPLPGPPARIASPANPAPVSLDSDPFNLFGAAFGTPSAHDDDAAPAGPAPVEARSADAPPIEPIGPVESVGSVDATPPPPAAPTPSPAAPAPAAASASAEPRMPDTAPRAPKPAPQKPATRREAKAAPTPQPQPAPPPPAPRDDDEPPEPGAFRWNL